MSASERRKGASGEREVVRMMHEAGWPDAKRTSDGASQGQRGDIAGGPIDTHWEVRRREQLSIWACLAQAERDAKPEDLPIVAFRRSRSGWYAALSLDALLALLLGYEE